MIYIIIIILYKDLSMSSSATDIAVAEVSLKGKAIDFLNENKYSESKNDYNKKIDGMYNKIIKMEEKIDSLTCKIDKVFLYLYLIIVIISCSLL